jgi:hypothetical protein
MRYTGFLPRNAKDTPIRLERAARLAFPDGTMSATGLRKEAKRGRLVIERIAGRDYVTLEAIERMRELCRVEPKASASISANAKGLPDKESGSSSTATFKSARDAAMMTAQTLKRRSPTT